MKIVKKMSLYYENIGCHQNMATCPQILPMLLRKIYENSEKNILII